MKILITTTPPEEAEKLVAQLLEKRLIGCGNIWGTVQSMYWWKGEIQRDPEKLIMMETTDELCGEAMEEISRLHSYEVPKIVALEPNAVHSPYLQWLQEETK